MVVLQVRVVLPNVSENNNGNGQVQERLTGRVLTVKVCGLVLSPGCNRLLGSRSRSRGQLFVKAYDLSHTASVGVGSKVLELLVWSSRTDHGWLTLTETIFGGINVDNCLLITNDMSASNLTLVESLLIDFFSRSLRKFPALIGWKISRVVWAYRRMAHRWDTHSGYNDSKTWCVLDYDIMSLIQGIFGRNDRSAKV